MVLGGFLLVVAEMESGPCTRKAHAPPLSYTPRWRWILCNDISRLASLLKCTEAGLYTAETKSKWCGSGPNVPLPY